MPSRLTGFVCPTVSMVTSGHATGVEKTLLKECGQSATHDGMFSLSAAMFITEMVLKDI